MIKTPFIAAALTAGLAAGYVAWRRKGRPAGTPELLPGIVIDSSKARAILDLGREVVGASVEQALSGRLGDAA